MYRQLVTTLGVLVAIMPFLGLPGSWKTPLYFILGGAIAGASYYSGVAKKKHVPGKPIVVRRSRRDFSSSHGAQPAAPVSQE